MRDARSQGIARDGEQPQEMSRGRPGVLEHRRERKNEQEDAASFDGSAQKNRQNSGPFIDQCHGYFPTLRASLISLLKRS